MAGPAADPLMLLLQTLLWPMCPDDPGLLLLLLLMIQSLAVLVAWLRMALIADCCAVAVACAACEAASAVITRC